LLKPGQIHQQSVAARGRFAKRHRTKTVPQSSISAGFRRWARQGRAVEKPLFRLCIRLQSLKDHRESIGHAFIGRMILKKIERALKIIGGNLQSVRL